MGSQSGVLKDKDCNRVAKEVRQLLEDIAQWEEIQRIIPGKIGSGKAVSAATIRVRQPMPNGLKCVARARNSVQEVFLITSKPEALQRRLASRFS